MKPLILYSQSSGLLSFDDGSIIQRDAYSGHGDGLNNHAMEAVRGVGPIPVGDYRIVRWDEHHGDLGPVVAILEPHGHDAHGRTLLRCHGDNSKVNHSASDGCIIANHQARIRMRDSGAEFIRVVA